MISPHFTHVASTLRTLFAFAVASPKIIFILESYLKWEKKKIEINYDSLYQDRKNELRLEYDDDAKY